MSKKNIIKICTELIIKILQLRYGNMCQICQQTFNDNELMTIHIKGKKAHPILRFTFLNLLYGDNNCHRAIEKKEDWAMERVKQLKGDDYKAVLCKKERMYGLIKLDYDEIKKNLKKIYKKELTLKNKEI